MKIEIIEGVEIDISSPLRKLRLKDGWYSKGASTPWMVRRRPSS
jgi:hypothetical protein